MKVYIVEVEAPSLYKGELIFNSAWSSRAAAEKYCERFRTVGHTDNNYDFHIIETDLQD